MAFQKSGTLGILIRTLILIVLRTIQFDDQFGFCAIKVSYIFS